MPSRRHITLFLLLGALLFGFLALVTSEGADVSALPENPEVESGAPTPSAESNAEASTTSAVEEKYFPVTKVIDGDTLVISLDGKTETIRLIGINTPETVDPRRPVECFGKEASAKAKSILLGASVAIVGDASQDTRDKYGRLLAYVFLLDGTNFNKLMIADGYAYEYTYRTPYQYQAEFKEAERMARTEGRGLWADGACGLKNATSSVPTPPASAPIPVTGAYVCDKNTYNCTSFTTQAEAQSAFLFCGGTANDIHKLDQDKDGVVCEGLP